MSASVPESPSGLRNAEPAAGDTKRHHSRVTAHTPHPPSPSAAVALEAEAGRRSSPSPPQPPLPCNFSPLPQFPAPNPKPPFPSCSTALAPPLPWVWAVWGAAGGLARPRTPRTSRLVVDALALAAGGVGEQRGLLVVGVHGAGGDDVVLVLVHQGQLGVVAP